MRHETDARIRRLAVARSAFRALALLVTPAFVVFVIVTTILTIRGGNPPDVWVWFVLVGVVLVSFLPLIVTSRRIDVARFADGEESLGTVTEIVTETGHEGEDLYHLKISAALPRGGSIHRVVRAPKNKAPHIGQAIRFRHNTVDPEALDDILFIDYAHGDTLRFRVNGHR